VEGEDPVVLAGHRARRGKPVLLGFDSELEGLRVAINGQVKGELPGGVVLEPGTHEVALEVVGADGRSERLWRTTLRLSDGDRLSFAELMRREAPRQVELWAGASLWPGTEQGRASVWLGHLTLVGRVRQWPLSRTALSLGLGLGYGPDELRLNQERLRASHLLTEAWVGLGPAWEVGRLVLHLDALAGVVYVLRFVDSPLYDSPRQDLVGRVGLRATARLRLGQSATVGLVAGGSYALGPRAGLCAEVGLSGGLGF
jgi:hypothetical protein